MEHFAIRSPRPKAVAPPTDASVQAEFALRRAQYRAAAACDDTDVLQAAAAAAERAGSWLPAAAGNIADCELLGQAQDIVARQRKQQRR